MNNAMSEIRVPNHQWKIRFSMIMIVLLLIGAGFYHSRNYFVEIFLSNQLSKLGYPLQSIAVIDLTINQLTIRNLNE